MINIELSKDQITIIDDADFEKVSKYKWHFTHGYARCDSDGKKTYLHRFILDAKIKTIVDHINGNTLDNRKENLRFLSHQENINHRTKLNKNNKSGYRGVYFETRTEKWVAKYKLNYKNIIIGKYDSKEKAIKAYKKKEI